MMLGNFNLVELRIRSFCGQGVTCKVEIKLKHNM